MKLNHCLLLALIVLPPLVMGFPGEAQTKTPPPPTLAASLSSARFPDDGGVVLAVDPDKVALPKDAALPDAGASPAEVAGAYGRTAQGFGLVTAIAPPTMTVLNTAPVSAGPFVGLPSEQALVLLLGSLSAAQWKQVTGERGLGAGDLVSDDQQALFEDTLPPAPWKVHSQARLGAERRDDDVKDLTAERPQARLRLRMHIGLNIPTVDGKSIVFVSPPTGPRTEAEGGHLYYIESDFGAGSPKLAGVAVRADVPNTPKPGDLDFDRKPFQTRVPLAGLKTVGDLVARIGGLARVELYADAHYEKKTLVVMGRPATARAADLLRALAFCLTGTYRRVGPAFVLTDDVQGLGTRRQILAEFDGDTQARRKAALDRAGKAMAGRSVLDLLPADPALAFSASERRQIEADRSYQVVGFVYQKFPFSALSAAQQQVVRTSTGRDETGASLPPDLTSQATLSASALKEWVLPSLDGPIPDGDNDTLFNGPPALTTAALPPAPAAAKPLPSWPALMKAVPQRAIHVHPRTAKQAEADVAAAKALELNQVWVDAFVNGEVRDVPLEAALKAASGSGVQVFAVLNLLNWGPKAKAEVADLTILGETSAQAEAREQARRAQVAADKGETLPTRTAPDILVSLFSPAVRETLRALTVRLAAKPGLAGQVWRETDPPGYTLLPGSVADSRPALGNTLPARLAFLRRAHADPLDLPTSRILLMSTDTSLPLYEGGRYADTLYDPLENQWRQMRSDADLALLHDLYAAIGSSPRRPLIIIQDRGDHEFEGEGWYGTWDTSKSPLPAFVDPWNHPAEGQPAFSWDNIAQARPQSRVILTRLPFDGLLLSAAVNAKVGPEVQGIVEQRAKTPKLAWDGFVLEAAQEALPE